MSNSTRLYGEHLVKDEIARKRYKMACYIHDIWYVYKAWAKENGKKPTADGLFEWLEGEIL